MKGSNGNESMALRLGRGLGRMAAPVVAMEVRFWGLLAKVGAPLPLLNLLKRIARLAAVAAIAMASVQYLFPVLVFLFALYAVCALSSSSNEVKKSSQPNGNARIYMSAGFEEEGWRDGVWGYGYYDKDGVKW
ncbi:DUF3742 family protein [Azotobacter bryophylli]|jgi:hypothetical protein|uniref:DUF3742 family protein n=1 Tax=Azotobacter bryophylli TaxID=1986537 RepID=A0ABV7AW50_9GAMM